MLLYYISTFTIILQLSLVASMGTVQLILHTGIIAWKYFFTLQWQVFIVTKGSYMNGTFFIQNTGLWCLSFILCISKIQMQTSKHFYYPKITFCKVCHISEWKLSMLSINTRFFMVTKIQSAHQTTKLDYVLNLFIIFLKNAATLCHNGLFCLSLI